MLSRNTVDLPLKCESSKELDALLFFYAFGERRTGNMGRKFRYLEPSERAEIEKPHNSAAKAAERIGYHTAAIYRFYEFQSFRQKAGIPAGDACLLDIAPWPYLHFPP